MADAQDIKIKSFLKFIRYAEHKREDSLGYRQLFGNKQTFTDMSKHPNTPQTAWGRTSTAAGAYQILYATWQEAVEKGIVRDFTESSQDKIATWKLRTRHALVHVQKGDIEHAIPLLRKEWTSMPGAAESTMSMKHAREKFDKYVNEFSEK